MIPIGLKQQIQRMNLEDELTPPQIAMSLGIAEHVVVAALSSNREAREKPSVGTALENHKDAIVASLTDLAVSAENEGVRAKAATEALKFINGVYDKKTKEDEGITAADMAEILGEAAKRYQEMQNALLEHLSPKVVKQPVINV